MRLMNARENARRACRYAKLCGDLRRDTLRNAKLQLPDDVRMAVGAAIDKLDYAAKRLEADARNFR